MTYTSGEKHCATMTGATSASSTVEDVTAVGAASQSPPLHDAAKPASPAATAAAAVPEHATPATAHEGANRAASASSRVGDVVRTVGAVIVTTFQYWLCLVQHLVRMWRGRPSYAQSRFFQREEELQVRCDVTHWLMLCSNASKTTLALGGVPKLHHHQPAQTGTRSRVLSCVGVPLVEQAPLPLWHLWS